MTLEEWQKDPVNAEAARVLVSGGLFRMMVEVARGQSPSRTNNFGVVTGMNPTDAVLVLGKDNGWNKALDFLLMLGEPPQKDPVELDANYNENNDIEKE